MSKGIITKGLTIIITMKKPPKLIHREISWLSFNERVLQEAQDPAVPLVERMKFLGIFSNNLDEFFKVQGGHNKTND